MMPVRSKRKLPSEMLDGATGKSTGSSNQTILPPSTACTPQFDAKVLNNVRPRPVAASLPYSLMDGKAGLPSATSIRMRSGRVWSVMHIGRRGVQHGVGHQLGGQKSGATGHLGREIAQMRRDPVASHRRAFHHRFEMQS